MGRLRERVCLQDGLKLDLNRLARQGLVRNGSNLGPRGIRWTHSYWGEVGVATITADLGGGSEGWLRLRMADLDQIITLAARPRRFGGQQWYFLCPATNRPASALWRPPGAPRFCSRQTWGRQVAYASQFMTATDRAHHGQSKIKARLIAELDPDDWALPPKPKRMRWTTYNRHVARYDDYEAVLDYGCAALVAKFMAI